MGLSFVVSLAAAIAAGCAPSLANLQPARVAPKGHIQAAAGLEIGIPTGTLSRVVDGARTLADTAQTQQISDDQKWQLFDAGVNLAVSPPAVGPVFLGAYSFTDRLEGGLRYALGGWRVGGRFQLLRHEDGPFDMVVGLGVARAANEIPIDKVLPVVEASDFLRWTVDVPLLIGTSRSWFHVWLGPKFAYSTFSTDMRLNLVNDEIPLAAFSGHALYLGGQGGLAVGYRNLFLGAELTLGHMSGSADATTTLTTAQRSTDLSGFVIYPAIGLMGEY
jgi:hypothetical protein